MATPDDMIYFIIPESFSLSRQEGHTLSFAGFPQNLQTEELGLFEILRVPLSISRFTVEKGTPVSLQTWATLARGFFLKYKVTFPRSMPSFIRQSGHTVADDWPVSIVLPHLSQFFSANLVLLIADSLLYIGQLSHIFNYNLFAV